MRKFIFMIALMLTFAFGATAQTATQNSKLFDNVYVGVTGGVTTPLDFNSVFPVNPAAGLKIGKEVTPVLGFEVEGLAILNDNHFSDIKTTVKATNVGLNGIINLSNLFAGYRGTPRTVEFKTNTGLGWLHTWNTSENALTAKTGVDVQFNLGKTKAHSITISPAVYWNLNKYGEIRFDKRGAQLGVFATYAYHFKTSNGTRHFKTYDVGALIAENERLASDLAKKPTEVVREVVKTVEVPTTNAVAESVTVLNQYVVSFAQNSYVLTDAAKTILDAVPQTSVVIVEATASPEGTEKYNLNLSQNRANAVAEYLKGHGVNVESATGLGVTGDDSQRVAKVIFK